MAITGSGLYGLTVEKMFIDTAGQSLEAETHKVMMCTDTYAPNFDTHDFRNDVTNEVAGTGYTTGGITTTGTEITIGSPAAGQLKFDSTTDPSWASSSIPDAMAAIVYFNVGASTTDMLVHLSDFVTAVTSSNGTFTIQVHADGWWYLDYTQ